MAARRPSAAPRPPSAPRRHPASRPAGRGTRRSRGRSLWRWLVGLVAAGLVLGVSAFAAAYALTSIPDPQELAEAQVSTVYYSDGTTPIGRFKELNRDPVTIDQVPVPVQRAVLAAEDRSFYENRGVSPTGIARALLNNVRGGDTQGGSTITQQYVKNYFLNADRTYARKFQEFFIALKVDQQQSKDETLAAYLNTVYFGRGAYGVQTAAQAYFGKDVSQLTASEGAVLAGLLAAPSAYDPRVAPEAAQQRWEYVMDGMVAEGWLSAEERAAATMPETIEPQPSNDWQGTDGYLLQVVRKELVEKAGLTETEIDRGGYAIVTTFDPEDQAAAVEAVRAGLPESTPEGLQVALASIDPRTGGVRAMYGGEDYLANQYNTVTRGRAQAGSTFKPFTLVAALEQGISLRSTFDGSSPMTLEGWDKPVSNFGGADQGRTDLLTATAKSTNTVYAQLNNLVTPEATKDVAVRAGLRDEEAAGLGTNPSNVLGTASPHPVDVAQAYATFAAQGVKREWHTVASVTGPAGEQTYLASPLTQRVFAEDVMADATYAMEQVVRRGSGTYAQRLGRPAAGKTGTSSSNMSAWFAGYTPQLATVVGLYQNDAEGDPVPLKIGSREVTGGSYPVRIWTSYMQGALQGEEELDLPDPAYVGKARGSSSTRTRSASPTQSATATPTETATETPGETPGQTPGETSGETPSGTPTSSTGSGGGSGGQGSSPSSSRSPATAGAGGSQRSAAPAPPASSSPSATDGAEAGAARGAED